jgi:hypothetical protein
MSLHPSFLTLYNAYPKKVNKWSANKAFSLLLQTERIEIDRLIKCAKIYALITEPRYYHDLGNWLRDDHWKNLYYEDDLDSILRNHQTNIELAEQIIDHWNANRIKWWLQVLDRKTKRAMLIDALQDEFFKENWKEAFDALLIVFKRRAHESNYYSKLTPNLEWFCKDGVTGRILEGHYGKWKKHNIVPRDKVLNDGVTHVLDETRNSDLEEMDVRKELDRLLNKPKNPFL